MQIKNLQLIIKVFIVVFVIKTETCPQMFIMINIYYYYYSVYASIKQL